MNVIVVQTANDELYAFILLINVIVDTFVHFIFI